MCLTFIPHIILVEESYGPALLNSKARSLRYRGGNFALHTRHAEHSVSISALARKYLVVPFRLLVTPVCAAMCLYGSFVYALIYVCFTAFPIEFQEVRGWNSLVGSLPFLGTLIGSFVGGAINLYLNLLYLKKLTMNNGKPVPEARLYPMMVGGVLLAAGLFLFAWTSGAEVHWIGPVMGAALIGTAFVTTFQAAVNYLVDTFQKHSASAIAANTVTRSLLAGGFPLFTDASEFQAAVRRRHGAHSIDVVCSVPQPRHQLGG